MASGKVARRTAVGDVGDLLDSPEVAALIDEIDASGDARGRKGYGARALVGACLVKGLFALPTWTRVAALIDEHPGLQAVLGGSPSVWACYRFATKLCANRPALAACLDACAASLRAQYPDMGENIAIDASDMAAFANGQRFVRNHGPKRERYSDPDASWGTRGSERFKSLYAGRSAVEREFGRLKNDYGLTPLRVRGLERVQLHADLTMLTRLGQALSRARAVPIAA
jgi:hypothetical protein